MQLNDVLFGIYTTHILARYPDWPMILVVTQSSADEDYAGSAEAEMFQGFGPSYMSVAGVARPRIAIFVEEPCFF